MADTIEDEKTLVTNESGDALKGFVPYVVVIEGPHHGTRYPLQSGENLAGRAPGCAILLDDASVSRQHLVITGRPDGWQVKDLGSKNGTFVNGSQIEEAVTVGHGDVIQTGIYAMRLVTHQISVDEELAPVPAEIALETGEPLTASDAEDGGHTEDELSEAPADDQVSESHTDVAEAGTEMIPADFDVEEAPEPAPKRNWMTWLKYGGALVVILGLGLYLTLQFTGKKAPPPPPPVEPVASQPLAPPPPPPPPPGPKMIPVFLDFASSPLPARISFEGKDYGITPVKVNMQLEVGKSYTAEGIFKLDELQEDYTERVNFTVAEDQTIIPILFKAPIGIFKVIALPRDVQLYVEGYFSYDQFHPHAAKLTDAPYGKPLYFPYGRYIIELRQPKPVAESGQFVDDIRYKREVFITEDNPSYNLDVTDKDMQVFPVDIRSIPAGADVFVDAAFMGRTPYKGEFPLGEHSLTLRKDGYFEDSKNLKVDINTQYSVEIPLKTTVAGEYIQKGKMALARSAPQEAINSLSEGLKQTPTPSETAQIQYLLGSAFAALGNIPTAQGYFEQAKSDPKVKYHALLGLVGIYHMQGQDAQALPLLVDVMLNTQDADLKLQATNAFKEVSPLRSVMYIYSDPAGATITINDQALPQRTPAIVRDLGLGQYRLRIVKEGYAPQDLKMDLTVNEFNPILVKLKPLEK